MSAPSSPKQNAAVAEAMERARSEAEKAIQAAMATAGTPPPAEPPPPIRNIAPPPAAPPPAPASPLKPPPITAVPERRPSVGLLNEIAEGKQLTPVEPGRQTPAPETMARGGLLNEIAKGKSLKHVEQTRPASNSATMARAGLLNELQHKRPKAAVTASSADAPSAAANAVAAGHPTPDGFGCWTSDASRAEPIGRMLAYLDGVASKALLPAAFTQSQALWQESADSVVIGTLRNSSLLRDEAESGLNAVLAQQVRAKRWAAMGLLEVNNVCDGGSDLQKALHEIYF